MRGYISRNRVIGVCGGRESVTDHDGSSFCPRQNCQSRAQVLLRRNLFHHDAVSCGFRPGIQNRDPGQFLICNTCCIIKASELLLDPCNLSMLQGSRRVHRSKSRTLIGIKCVLHRNFGLRSTLGLRSLEGARSFCQRRLTTCLFRNFLANRSAKPAHPTYAVPRHAGQTARWCQLLHSLVGQTSNDGSTNKEEA